MDCYTGLKPGLQPAAMADPAKIEQFVAVTGVTEDAAKFYLDSSSGDVETAINQFYATGGVQEAPEASAEDFMDVPEEHEPGKRAIQAIIALVIGLANTDIATSCQPEPFGATPHL